MADTLAGVKDAVAALKVALGKIQERAVKAVQKNAQPARRDIATAYEAQHYFNRAGVFTPIKPYGRRWGARKALFGYSLKVGTATGGVQKVLNKASAVTMTAKGFVIDFARAAVGVTTRYRNRPAGVRKKRGDPKPATRTVQVASYMTFHARKKAPGLGSISDARGEKIRADVDKATKTLIKNTSRSIRPATTQRGGLVLKATFDLFISGRAA